MIACYLNKYGKAVAAAAAASAHVDVPYVDVAHTAFLSVYACSVASRVELVISYHSWRGRGQP